MTATGRERRRGVSLGTRILYGVLAGVACGVLLGELTAPLDVIGKIYVGLLQMTVLPYVMVSLIQKIGGLTFDAAKRLAGRAGVVMVVLWAIALLTVLVLPLSLPDLEAGSFFTSSLVERPQEFDFLGLYLPTNPFHSLANNVVPAVVLFSIFLGAALIGIPAKRRLLEPLAVVSDTLSRISGFVVRLSPWGTFALTAGAAGTLSPGELLRLAGYVSSHTIGVVVLALVVLPGLVAAVTPIRFRRVLQGLRDAMLTAFATGKLFAVLPIVISNVKQILVDQDLPEDEAEMAADIFVPLAYPFPNSGKVLSLIFIPFAAWYIGRPLEFADYPLLLTVGLFASFGSLVAAIPFLLDLLRLPTDLFPLFLVAGIWCARVSDVLGAVHLAVFSLLCAGWHKGWVRLRQVRLVKWLVASIVVGGLALAGNRLLVSASLVGQERTRDLVANMDLSVELTRIEVDEEAGPNPHPRAEGESRLDRIRRTGELRVCYVPRDPPFCYRNAAGRIVGLDVDLAQRLARDLDVTLRLIPLARPDIAGALENDICDLAIGEIASTIRSLGRYHESISYLSLHAALLVPDHRAKEFRTIEDLQAFEKVRIGYEAGGLQFLTRQHVISGLEAVEVPSAEAFLEGRTPDIDALLTTAESGAVFTMIHTDFSVVIPKEKLIEIPLVYAVRESGELLLLLDTWIRLKRADGTIDLLYDHWILGKSARKRGPRWSVVRDLFGWVD